MTTLNDIFYGPKASPAAKPVNVGPVEKAPAKRKRPAKKKGNQDAERPDAD